MNDAPQHRSAAPGPNPLPLFLDLVARVAATDPALARAALDGLRVYRAAPRPSARMRPTFARHGRATLLGQRHHRQPVVLIPSLINGSAILDLSPDLSLVDWLETAGFDALLLDWGTPSADDAAMTIDDHVSQLLIPLLRTLEQPAHLIGYCLGGTMAVAAAHLLPARSLTLLATPWRFAGYPSEARAATAQFWHDHHDMTQASGALPIAWLQKLFWGLDPDRTVAKYAALAGLPSDHVDVMRFAMVEDWSNGGAAIPWGAAEQLFESMLRDDGPGSGRWVVDGRVMRCDVLPGNSLQIVASDDRIVPAATKADGVATAMMPGGHVGMIVGRNRVALRQMIATQLRQSSKSIIATQHSESDAKFQKSDNI